MSTQKPSSSTSDRPTPIITRTPKLSAEQERNLEYETKMSAILEKRFDRQLEVEKTRESANYLHVLGESPAKAANMRTPDRLTLMPSATVRVIEGGDDDM